MSSKWIFPILPYLAVWVGLFLLHSAWLALIGFHLAILFSLLLARPAIPISLLFKSKSIKWILASVLLCGFSGIALYLLWYSFGIYPDLSAQLSSIGLNSASWILFIAYFTLINPLIEEYFWRGFLGSGAKKLYGGDFIFAGYHAFILWGKAPFSSILISLALLVAAGWFWRQIQREDEGLLAPVLGHAAADFSILLCVYLQI